jgi:pimeloyl-ACP methyl ester carboxylesterase
LRRGWKILIAVIVVLAVLLAANTIAIDNETKPAGVTIEGGEILELSGGDVQVWEDGPTEGGSGSPPIVLIHCYACSLHWWDRLVPLLSERHRVVRVDLLGHGGSEKPQSGYSMEDQAGLVAEALNRLGVEGAVVVGHSLGGTVATALAEQSSELVDRVVDVDQAPDDSFGDPSLVVRLAYVPVLGQVMNRVTPDFVIKDGYEEAFAPGYDLDRGFEDPDQVVEDLHAMTYTSFDEVADAERDYSGEIPLDERLATAAVPLLVVFGSEDQVYDAEEAIAAFEDVPGVRTAMIEGAGHSPNIEDPEQTARLILEFANEAGDEAGVPQPPRKGGKGKSQAKSKGKNARTSGRGKRKPGDKRSRGRRNGRPTN